MSIQPKTRLTPERYLEIEREAEYKSEYFNGEMFAFAGATESHVVIVGNISANFHAQLRNKKCKAYTNDMRVKVNITGLYTYPDVVAVCGEPKFEDEHRDTLLNPIVIIEVLSPSTENYDRGTKFEHYRAIKSLSDYILVAQDKIHVEHYVRQSDRSWLFSEYKSLIDKFQIQSIGCEVSLEEIYEKVEMEGSN
jgi:Uma2 family endonuclease